MGLFSREFKNVIEWNETRDDVMFWKYPNNEIKKDSRLIIKPGQDAIFFANGMIEGVFTDSGSYLVDSEIIPFLSTLKGFKFGFNSGLRAEVLFVNTKEFQVKWGTRTPINLPHPQMPGGMPIRMFGSYVVKIDDYVHLIESIAGVKQQFLVEDVKGRVSSKLDQLLTKWIIKEGKDMLNIQANSFEICKGIMADLDMEMLKLGLRISDFVIENVNYPEQIQKMIEKNASYSMVGSVDHYQRIATIESLENNPSGMAGQMMQAGMGMQMMNNMVQGMKQQSATQQNMGQLNSQYNGSVPKFCPECGNKTNGAKFCGECGTRLVV